MNFAHFQIKVDRQEGQFIGSWRAGLTHSLDHQFSGQNNIPLGKRMTRDKLEDFVLDVIARACVELEELQEETSSQ